MKDYFKLLEFIILNDMFKILVKKNCFFFYEMKFIIILKNELFRIEKNIDYNNIYYIMVVINCLLFFLF